MDVVRTTLLTTLLMSQTYKQLSLLGPQLCWTVTYLDALSSWHELVGSNLLCQTKICHKRDPRNPIILYLQVVLNFTGGTQFKSVNWTDPNMHEWRSGRSIWRHSKKRKKKKKFAENRILISNALTENKSQPVWKKIAESSSWLRFAFRLTNFRFFQKNVIKKLTPCVP